MPKYVQTLWMEKYRVDNDPRFAIERMRGGDGYDVLSAMENQTKWRAVASWGADGWDMGDWPYVVQYVKGDTMLASYCEGDVTTYDFPDRETRDRALDDIAFWHWQMKGREWVEGIDPDSRPDYLRGPWRVRATG